MIATIPDYYVVGSTFGYGFNGYGYRQCRCTRTVCQCFTQYVPTYVSIETTPKREANKRRMESIPRRAPVDQRMRMKMPAVRPSIQALSIRIR